MVLRRGIRRMHVVDIEALRTFIAVFGMAGPTSGA
jgi:hypothetical protein